jgi:hypothetical protein
MAARTWEVSVAEEGLSRRPRIAAFVLWPRKPKDIWSTCS